MKMFKPSDLKAFLEECGVGAKKGLSQHFLIDGNIIQKILATAHVAPQDEVLEIGPGPGALTQALLEKGARVTAVEMDPIFGRALERLQVDDRLRIIVQDFLAFPLHDYLKDKRCKVIANLPYHITTPILTLLLPLYPQIESTTVMVQKEFAERMMAKTRTPAYSHLTLFVQFYSAVKDHFPVSRNCFYPRPKVDSTVVHCKLHSPLLKNPGPFFQLTRTAFGHRRKMLRASLKEMYSPLTIEEALEKIGHSLRSRPEELTLDDFLSFYDVLQSKMKS